MLIQSEFDIRFSISDPTAMVALLHMHPSIQPRVRSGGHLLIESFATSTDGALNPTGQGLIIPSTDYLDSFGNRCARLVAPPGLLKLSSTTITVADPFPDKLYDDAQQSPVEDLPSDVLQFLLPSRYCEVDQFQAIARDLFSDVPSGWTRATAIRDWVHKKVMFHYGAARPTKTAMDVYTERIGVCRDFQHLAITLSRCLNIPARYVTGYIGDIRRPYSGPGDFSAWYQVFLDGKWINLDARHNYPRFGRVLMATGRDAADVAMTTSFSAAWLTHFFVDYYEINAAGNRIPLPQSA